MISTKGRYALRVMLDLAMQDPERYIPLKEIASRQELSEKYLEIILKTLVKQKLLRGMRGKGGGYQLTRAPKDYTVGEILMPDAESCDRASCCLTLPMWQKFDSMVHDFFFGISLADLLENRSGQTTENQSQEL